MSSSVKICVACKHHRMVLGEHVCNSQKVNGPAYLDFVTGEAVPAKQRRCREANAFGNCDHYESK